MASDTVRAMRQGITTAVCAAAALITLAAGCRQIVGIGDRTSGDATVPSDAATDGPGCGVDLGDPGDCNACVQAHCCAAAEACENVPVCKAIEGCFAGCAGDATCLTGCSNTFPPSSTLEYAAIESCIASSCSAACSLTCDRRTIAGPPDSGDACQQCVVTNACPQSEACGTSTDCQRVVACNDACRTIDCAFACQAAYDAGTPAFSALGSQMAQCEAQCLGGQHWGCVGHVTWPTPTTTQNTVSVMLHGLHSAAIVGADVKLCSTLAVGCASILGEATSDDGGNVVIPYAADPNFGGLDAYMMITGSGLATTLFYWNFPLSEQHANVSTVEALTPDDVSLALAAEQIAPVPGHGHVGVIAFDCTHTYADGVRFDVAPVDANTRIVYAKDGAISADAGETDYSGIAFIGNVPAGTVDLNVTSVATGLLVSHVSFVVVDGAIHQVFALPTPQ